MRPLGCIPQVQVLLPGLCTRTCLLLHVTTRESAQPAVLSLPPLCLLRCPWHGPLLLLLQQLLLPWVIPLVPSQPVQLLLPVLLLLLQERPALHAVEQAKHLCLLRPVPLILPMAAQGRAGDGACSLLLLLLVVLFLVLVHVAAAVAVRLLVLVLLVMVVAVMVMVAMFAHLRRLLASGLALQLLHLGGLPCM